MVTRVPDKWQTNPNKALLQEPQDHDRYSSKRYEWLDNAIPICCAITTISCIIGTGAGLIAIGHSIDNQAIQIVGGSIIAAPYLASTLYLAWSVHCTERGRRIATDTPYVWDPI